MKRLIAFLTALVLFLGTVLGLHIYNGNRMDLNNNAFGTWTNEVKFKSWEAISANLNQDTMVIFGSSELEHGKNTPFHPESMFKGQKFNTMLIGAGYYQCLSHAITLGAIAPDMKNKKVVLLLSPQWFRKKGVLPEAYASRFSESNYLAMMKNDKISDKTKAYITQRSESLLKDDKPTRSRVSRYEKIFLKKDASPMDYFYYQLYSHFLREKTRQSVLGWIKKDHLGYDRNQDLKDQTIDFDSYRETAGTDGAMYTGSNPFYIKDSYFERHLKKNLKKRKNTGGKSSYSQSPEYDDLRCFLDVCRESGIEPLLVNIPVNGWWYDYTGFTKEKRQEYYQNIRDIAANYQVQMADFSDREYEKYFLEDTMHLGWKGWVDVDESIYNFAK